MSTTSVRTLLVAAVSLVALAAVADAAAYTVTLKNGNTFETRYRPYDVDWDASGAMILTDQGNAIAIKKNEIAEVTALAESKGFGYQLNTTTLYLGWSPNDVMEIAEDGTEKSRFDTEPPPPPPADYTLQQFIDVPVVGSPSTGGVPVTDTDNL